MAAPELAAIDLHLHSALSPCANPDMTPPAMLLAAERRGLRVVGVVDHSASGNAWAMLEAAPAFAVRVLVGTEVESIEGVHLLALFDTAEQAEGFSALVHDSQPPLRNRPEFFGEQWLLDEWGNLLGLEERLLAVGCNLTLERLAEAATARGGLVIPAHIDRQGNGLLSILGWIPRRLDVPLFELSRFTTPAEAQERWPELRARALVTGSDAHCLQDIGSGRTLIPAALAASQLPAAEWGQAVAEFLRGELARSHA